MHAYAIVFCLVSSGEPFGDSCAHFVHIVHKRHIWVQLRCIFFLVMETQAQLGVLQRQFPTRGNLGTPYGNVKSFSGFFWSVPFFVFSGVLKCVQSGALLDLAPNLGWWLPSSWWLSGVVCAVFCFSLNLFVYCGLPYKLPNEYLLFLTPQNYLNHRPWRIPSPIGAKHSRWWRSISRTTLMLSQQSEMATGRDFASVCTWAVDDLLNFPTNVILLCPCAHIAVVLPKYASWLCGFWSDPNYYYLALWQMEFRPEWSIHFLYPFYPFLVCFSYYFFILQFFSSDFF